MRAPAFWWRSRPGVRSRLLAPLAAVVAGRAERRLGVRGVAAPLPVICVGNPVVGGAGKTPTALALGETATAMGLLPVFLTRGYGGSLRGPVLVNGQHGAADRFHLGVELLRSVIVLHGGFPDEVRSSRTCR